MSMTRKWNLALITLALLGLAACGGGGGGGGEADASLLEGSYFVSIYQLISGTPDSATSTWATAALDGAGDVSGTGSANVAGTIVGPLPLTGTYTVAADRETTLVTSIGFAGWTEASGSLALLGNVTAAETPAAACLVKLGAGFSDADLQGDWGLAFLALDNAGVSTRTFWGSVTLDALAEGTASIATNIGGAISAPSPAGVSFDVTGNGQTTSLFDGADLEGAVHASKDLIILNGVVTGAGFPAWGAYVRKTSGASESLLSGTYQIVGLERDGSGFASISGSVQANGAGSVTVTFTKNTDGTITSEGPIIVPYSVAGDGTLTVDPLGEPTTGVVSPTGDYAMLTGPTSALSNPRMYLLMRR